MIEIKKTADSNSINPCYEDFGCLLCLCVFCLYYRQKSAFDNAVGKVISDFARTHSIGVRMELGEWQKETSIPSIDQFGKPLKGDEHDGPGYVAWPPLGYNVVLTIPNRDEAFPPLRGVPDKQRSPLAKR